MAQTVAGSRSASPASFIASNNQVAAGPTGTSSHKKLKAHGTTTTHSFEAGTHVCPIRIRRSCCIYGTHQGIDAKDGVRSEDLPRLHSHGQCQSIFFLLTHRYLCPPPHLTSSKPVFMVNLLAFKPHSGAADYARYSAAVTPLVAKVGGKSVYSASIVQPIATGSDGSLPPFDFCVIVMYPSVSAFVSMTSSAEYRGITHMRTAALTRSALLATDGKNVRLPMDVSEGAPATPAHLTEHAAAVQALAPLIDKSAVALGGATQPLFMLNLLKFNAPDTVGRQHFARYAAGVFPMIMERGGGPVFSGNVAQLLIGDDKLDDYEAVMIVRCVPHCDPRLGRFRIVLRCKVILIVSVPWYPWVAPLQVPDCRCVQVHDDERRVWRYFPPPPAGPRQGPRLCHGRQA
jgi:uncharacterized protein (DUF1330 family)